MANKVQIVLEVDDKGTPTVKTFSKNLEKGLDKGSTKAKKFTKNIGKAAKKMGSVTLAVGKTIAKVGALGAALALAAGGFLVKKAVGAFATFESALVRVGNVSKEALGIVKQKIMDLPPALGNVTDLVKGYYQVMSAGVKDPIEAMNLLRTAAKMSKESQIEMGDTVKGLAALYKTYADELKDASDAADLMYKIEAGGITSVKEIIPYIGNLASTSKALGLSVEELAASLAQVTSKGQGTAKAVTQLEGLFTAFMRPTKELIELFEEFGGVQEAIKEIGYEGVLRKIEKATGGSTEAMIKLLGTKEGVQAFLILAEKGFKGLATQMDEMKNRTGGAESAWKRYMGTLNAIWETFKSTVGKQLVMIGEHLAPSIKNVVEALGGWLEKNRELIAQEVGAWIEKIVTFARSLKPAFDEIVGKISAWYQVNKGMLQLKFVDWLDNAAKAINSLAKDIETILTPLVALAKGVMAVGKALAYVASKAVDAYNWLKKVSSMNIKSVISFFGRGSSEMPLTDKLKELTGEINDFSNCVSCQKPKYTVDITDAMASLRLVASTAVQVQAIVAGASAHTLENVKGMANDMVAAINDKVKSMSAALAKYAMHMKSGLGNVIDMEKMRRRMMGQLSDMKKRYQLQLQFAAGLSEFIIPYMGGYQYNNNYQSGTGPQGLPQTGLFYGHKGEIVKSPAESQEERRGNTGNTYNITLSPMFMTGDRASMRNAAPALKEALEELEHRWN